MPRLATVTLGGEVDYCTVTHDPGNTLTKEGSFYSAVAFFVILAAFPFYWMIVSSFRPEAEMYAASLLPKHWTWDNYAQAWNTIPVLGMLSNTAVMSIVQTVSQLAMASQRPGANLGRAWRTPTCKNGCIWKRDSP